MTTGEFFQRDRTLHPPALTPNYKTSVKRSPQHALLSLQNSMSEITGPVWQANAAGIHASPRGPAFGCGRGGPSRLGPRNP